MRFQCTSVEQVNCNEERKMPGEQRVSQAASLEFLLPGAPWGVVGCCIRAEDPFGLVRMVGKFLLLVEQSNDAFERIINHICHKIC